MFDILKQFIDWFFIWFNWVFNFEIELYQNTTIKVGYICIGIALIIVLIDLIVWAIGGKED